MKTQFVLLLVYNYTSPTKNFKGNSQFYDWSGVEIIKYYAD